MMYIPSLLYILPMTIDGRLVLAQLHGTLTLSQTSIRDHRAISEAEPDWQISGLASKFQLGSGSIRAPARTGTMELSVSSLRTFGFSCDCSKPIRSPGSKL